LSEGGRAVREDYRKFVPTREERETVYAGIGIEYRGILLRQNFESCLGFYEQAKKSLPGALRTRAQILADIRASASRDKKELISYYQAKGDADSVRVVKNYL